MSAFFIIENPMKEVRKRILVRGIVQGVGFRPFVYQHASRLSLKGFVQNSPQGVIVELQGHEQAVHECLEMIKNRPPVLAHIREIEIHEIPLQNETQFSIMETTYDEELFTLISSDIATCEECLSELFDPQNRRYRYPFINCTNCGPRYTIIQEIPYDRKNTTMASFSMCAECEKEYHDPVDRRFHAQPNACPICGPKVWLTDSSGHEISCQDPIRETAVRLKQGQIVAIKGLGGFHLACDATNEEAVRRLRMRKAREEKPLAVMAPDIETISRFAECAEKEKALLLFPQRPIVLLSKKPGHALADSVAPRNPYFGVMLPYTPLHHLLLREGFIALVMTSGNLSEEPIVFKNDEALFRLKDIADVFLLHNREIYIRTDDSVIRWMAETPVPIRRARGYVPIPIFLKRKMPSVLGVGGELKNTICLLKNDQAFLSHHIGDLENSETLSSFELAISHLSRILEIYPEAIAHDLHPDYLSTQWALVQKDIPKIGIQHHHAHIVSCLAENKMEERVIGIALDGTGYGTDEKIWGGEVLLADLRSFQRVAHFSYRPMPGGTMAIREPWRMATAYLWHAYCSENDSLVDEATFQKWIAPLPFVQSIEKEKWTGLVHLLSKGTFHFPETSSLGRLFDGVSALIGLRTRNTFEGQAAMELEMVMEDKNNREYPFELQKEKELVFIDPDPLILAIFDDIVQHRSPGEISAKFHRTVVQIFLQLCLLFRDQYHLNIVALSGGCFQNRFLFENLLYSLEKNGFKVLHHREVPPNDAGLSLGQAISAAYQLKMEK